MLFWYLFYKAQMLFWHLFLVPILQSPVLFWQLHIKPNTILAHVYKAQILFLATTHEAQ